MPEIAEPDRSAEEEYLQEIRYRCQRARETGNNLHYFEALGLALSASASAALCKLIFDEKDIAATNRLAAQALLQDRSIILPGELCEFLAGVLRKLRELSKGLDFRDFPALTGNDELDRECWKRYIARADYSGDLLSSEKASNLLSQALNLTKQGRSAFQQSIKERRAQDAQWLEARRRQKGFSAGEARDESMARFGFSDERSYRRFKSGKQRSSNTKKAPDDKTSP